MPDEQGANSPARYAEGDPDLAPHPRWSVLPPRSAIGNWTPLPVFEPQPAPLPARRRISSRSPRMPRVSVSVLLSASINLRVVHCPFVLGRCLETVSPPSRIHLGLGVAMELALSVIGQMASQYRLWESAGL